MRLLTAQRAHKGMRLPRRRRCWRCGGRWTVESHSQRAQTPTTQASSECSERAAAPAASQQASALHSNSARPGILNSPLLSPYLPDAHLPPPALLFSQRPPSWPSLLSCPSPSCRTRWWRCATCACRRCDILLWYCFGTALCSRRLRDWRTMHIAARSLHGHAARRAPQHRYCASSPRDHGNSN